MSVLDACFETIRGGGARVVLPEWDEPRMRLARDGLKDLGLVPMPVAEASDAQIAAVMAARGATETLARRMLTRPVIRAAAMVGSGEADVMVAGIETPTKRVIEAAMLAIGLHSGIRSPSSFFLMVFPDGREFVFADCAVTVAPDAQTLASIARSSEQSALALLKDARVAMLSYSTGASGTGPDVDRVREAAEMTGFTGPVQVDAALNPVIAKAKGIEGGDANVLIFPSLDAGNIAYKLCQELAGAQAVGPFLQGFARPVCDLSRGATPDDIVAATAVTLALHAKSV